MYSCQELEHAVNTCMPIGNQTDGCVTMGHHGQQDCDYHHCSFNSPI